MAGSPGYYFHKFTPAECGGYVIQPHWTCYATMHEEYDCQAAGRPGPEQWSVLSANPEDNQGVVTGPAVVWYNQYRSEPSCTGILMAARADYVCFDTDFNAEKNLKSNSSISLHQCRFRGDTPQLPGTANYWYYAPLTHADCSNGLPATSTCLASLRRLYDCSLAAMTGTRLANGAVVNFDEFYGTAGPFAAWSNFGKCSTYPSIVDTDYLCIGSNHNKKTNQVALGEALITLHQCEFFGQALPLPGFTNWKYHSFYPEECEGGLPDTSNCVATVRWAYDCSTPGAIGPASYAALNKNEVKGVEGPAAVWYNPSPCLQTTVKVDYLCFH